MSLKFTDADWELDAYVVVFASILLEWRINKRWWHNVRSTSQLQQMTQVFSGKCCFVFICSLIWKLCYWVDCWDHFCKIYCLSSNNFYCKIGPIQGFLVAFMEKYFLIPFRLCLALWLFRKKLDLSKRNMIDMKNMKKPRVKRVSYLGGHKLCLFRSKQVFVYNTRVVLEDQDEQMECYQLIEDRIGEPVEKLYYCVPGMPLSTGIRWIEDDVDYAFWLDTGEENGEIAVYADNSGMTLDECKVKP
ncbi:hypothetical protein LXL04_016964 [Taraxacum kok-saghyz]